ncbi:MAG: phosphate transport system regulatory protein PhoU [Kordiimonadales bacterium]|nr:MAG: phosphate transport system regulatory protein PhoU [Kordiimonadales bacterium]
MPNHHIVQAFDAELETLDALIAQMGFMAQKQQEKALNCFLAHDKEAAKKVRDDDEKLDACERHINAHATQIFARRQPVAADLRTVVASFKIAGDLERIGDHAKNMAKRTKRVGDIPILAEVSGSLRKISRLVETMISDVIKAFTSRDAGLALAVLDQDEAVDLLHKCLISDLLSHMKTDTASIAAGTEILFAVKNIERIGDHATNIAEQVYYIVTGRQADEGDGAA